MLVAVLAGTLWLVLAPSTASAQPPVGLTIQDISGNEITPYTGEEFFAQSTPRETPGGRENWVCHVDFGDGTSGGYWRGHSYDTSVPCAATHAYAAAGTYTLVMMITDAAGGSVSEQRQMVIEDRKVTARDGGVEGTPVSLSGPGSGGTVQWSFADPSVEGVCRLDRTVAQDVVATCQDNGTFRVDYDTGDPDTSGSYDLTYVNGAPRPTMRATRLVVRRADPDGHYTRVRRVGTGDQVRFAVNAHDPSTYQTFGDRIRCAFNHGNGLREAQEAYIVKGTCNGQTSYLAPGRHTGRVRVTDKDGATATARSSVMVVRRDVHVAVRDVRRGGTRGVIRASLTPRGLEGQVTLRFPSGQRLVATRLTSLQVVSTGSVTLLGKAEVDGRSGYRFVAFPESRYPQRIAFSVYAWRAGKPDRYVVNETVYRDQFRVRLHAPPVH